MTARWLIVADDLTGAADCAIAFAKRGMAAVVSWGERAWGERASGEGIADAAVLSVDADSRRFPAAQAAARQLAAQAAHWRAGTRLYKKIDSTLRGQPAAELAAQLQALAARVAPKYHLDGYAATLAPYEGLTVNFAEAVQSAGGSILSPDGTQVTVNSPEAVNGLDFLVDGVRQGWIPSADLGYEEVSAQQAFESGKFLFLNDWPDVYAAASQPGPDNDVVGKFGVVALPGLSGPGSSSLGGANLAISAYSQHQRTALDFISYLTDLANETTMLKDGGFPPVWKQLYNEPSLRKQFPYLPVLEQAIDSAQPRPVSAEYDQASLVISSAVQAALRMRETPKQALSQMASQLTQIIQ